MGRIKKIESSDSDIQIVPSLQDVQDVQQANEPGQHTGTEQSQKSGGDEVESAGADPHTVLPSQNEREVQQTDESRQDTETEQPQKSKEDDVEVPSNILELMRLYPQYSEFWVTPEGFVHPKGMSTRLLKDAILYKNKFYNQ